MRIALFGKEFNSSQLDYIRILVETLESRGCKILVWKPFHDFMKNRISFRREISLFQEHGDLKGKADMLFSVGGDGTINAAPLPCGARGLLLREQKLSMLPKFFLNFPFA